MGVYQMRLVRWILIVVIISFCLELILSNYNVISCLKLPHNCVANNVVTYIGEEEKAALKIDQIEYKVKNITIMYAENTGELVRYTVFVDQYGQEGWEIEYPEKWDVARKNTRISTNCVTPVHSLRIEGDFSLENIEQIILNSTMIKFNFLRFFLVAMIGLFFILGKVFFEREASLCWRYIICIATIINFLVVAFAVLEQGGKFRIMQTPENQDMNLVVEALAVRQVYFLPQPSEELIQMDNPYDYTLRTMQGVPYLFDATYYDGKFYTYFGVGPVLVLMLPYYMLTGKYLHTYVANLIFMIILIYLLAICYHLCIKRYVHKVSVVLYIIGYITLIIGSGFLTLLAGQKYDISVTCALDFVLMSIILLLCLLENNHFARLKLFLGGGTAGLIVLSKPNFIVYYIPIGALLYMFLKKNKSKGIYKQAVWFIIPLGCCALFQMWYNYARFDNVFEFGNQYQVGANIQMFNYFSILKIFKGLMGYLFTLPLVDVGNFPFITLQNGVEKIGMNTYSIVDACIGLVAIPVIYILCFKKRMVQEISVKAEGQENISFTVNIMIIIATLNIVVSTVAASINDEYLIDVRGLLILASTILYFRYISLGKDVIHGRIFVCLCIATLLIMLPISLNAGRRGSLLFGFNKLNVFLKNIFEFW